MPTWGELLLELQGNALEQQRAAQLAGGQLPPGSPSPFDRLRRRWLGEMHAYTGRAVIVYESAFLEARPMDPNAVMIHLADVQGFMEACSNVEERSLDLIVHSPGGLAEAAESIVEYLRTRFDHVRIIVPHAAMSAATMLALAADELVMGSQSQLGPIDPQFTLPTPEGPRSAPGQAILDQFEQAKAECRDPSKLPAWLPILRMYGPGLIANITHQHELAQDLVAGWVSTYLCRAMSDRTSRAREIAAWLADFKTFRSHARPLHRGVLREHGVPVTDLEDDDRLQELLLSVHHATQLTLSLTQSLKIVENHHGRAWIKMGQVVGVPISLPGPPRPPAAAPLIGQPSP